MERIAERAHGRQRQQRGWLGQPTPSLPGARATPAQPASGGGCLPQPRWAVCATGVGAHQGQTNREGEKDIWWTAWTARGGTGHLGRTETQRGRLWTACGQRCVDGKNSQTTQQQQAHPQYANYWAPLTRKRHTMPHSAQSRHTNYWAPRTRKRHQQDHRPQRPTESSDPTQHAKGRTGDRPGPRKGATTRRNVTQGGHANGTPCHIQHSPNTPTTGLRERGNDTSKSTGRSGRQKVATRRNMRREERVTVQGPVKEQQPD